MKIGLTIIGVQVDIQLPEQEESTYEGTKHEKIGLKALHDLQEATTGSILLKFLNFKMYGMRGT
jgi:hypothetical protein